MDWSPLYFCSHGASLERFQLWFAAYVLPRSPNRCHRTTGSQVPCMRPNQDHATLYTGHRLVSNSGFLPDLSRECGLPPVSMSSFTFRYVIGGSLSFVFFDSHQTRGTSRLPVTLNTLALYQSILRWFGGAPCWAPPVGLPPSHAQHSCQEASVN